jgi:hypothetical protein
MTETIRLFEHAQVLPPFRFQFPARMTAVALDDGGVALISPVPMDDAIDAQLRELGEVRYLIAPNLLHSSYLAAAHTRYPSARVVAPRGLRAKKPELTIHCDLEDGLPEPLARALTMIKIEGAPVLDEFTFFHHASRTLVVTDLVFNIRAPQGWFANMVLWIVGCHGKLAMTRSWRMFSRDRAATWTSIERLFALPFDTLVMAHGDVVRDHARERLAEAARWLTPSRRALPRAA